MFLISNLCYTVLQPKTMHFCHVCHAPTSLRSDGNCAMCGEGFIEEVKMTC
jgi:hypothetical protein